jgi:uncharacterized low-complexity protein
MDQLKFDRLTQLVSAAGSRRQTLRAVLGAALLGATTTHAAVRGRRASKSRRKTCVDENCPPTPDGKPGTCCAGKHCTCNGECCPGRCFQEAEAERVTAEYCCVKPDWMMCDGPEGEPVCCPYDLENPCSCVGGTVITGSYRRR